MTLRIFISYSQEDFKVEARYLQNYLSKYIPNSVVFIDQIKPKGIKWKEEIEQNLVDCNIFVVILTNGAIKSGEVEKEVLIAKKESDRQIIPCKDNLLNFDWCEIPWGLGDYDGVEFEHKEELGRRLVGSIRTIQKLQSGENQKQTGKTKTISISGIKRNIDLDYEITGGEILSSVLDRDSNSLVIGIVTYENGILKLNLPRNVIDARYGEDMVDFFVLADGSEIDFQESVTEHIRTLQIPFDNGNTMIEIIGTEILGMSFVGEVKKENIVKILPDSNSPHGGKYLEPETLTIKVGEKVSWINEDLAAHTITSGDIRQDGPDGKFNSGLFLSGKSFEVTFNHTGEFRYFCQVHPWQQGKIIVK